MLEAQKLAARRGFATLFSGLTFRVGAGEAIVVSGANGTGKTTLLRIVAGLTTPAEGVLAWNGEAVKPLDPEFRGAVAYGGHLPALKDELSAEENLASLLALDGEAITGDALRSALDDVALVRQRALPARVLSQGQRRRIGLARLMLMPRPLWILDEPTTALDASGIELLGRVLGRHLAAGGILIAATHAALGLPRARVKSVALG
ncbi:MAG TPA: cytochrome c biogenesis heme-transporting ATPase CcmA [Casimicrobiaceae bacterium]|nr:cytochrome c biogenesis heme-transporting ATPase CcmA [Casimicrobiaceae bacterium]